MYLYGPLILLIDSKLSICGLLLLESDAYIRSAKIILVHLKFEIVLALLNRNSCSMSSYHFSLLCFWYKFIVFSFSFLLSLLLFRYLLLLKAIALIVIIVMVGKGISNTVQYRKETMSQYTNKYKKKGNKSENYCYRKVERTIALLGAIEKSNIAIRIL